MSAPAYAVALWPQDEEEQLAPYPVSIGLEPDRQRALTDLTGLQLFEAVWNANDFAIDGLELDEPPESADYRQAEAIVIGGLEERDIFEPGRWVLDRVAQRLQADRCLTPVTDDFVAFTLDEDLGDELLASVRFVAPESVVAALEAKGLLPRSIDDLLPESF